VVSASSDCSFFPIGREPFTRCSAYSSIPVEPH
jgi:hypothetical protein